MRTARSPARLLCGVWLGVAITGCASVEPPGIQPVSLESGTNDIRLSFVGRYSFGFYDIGAAAPAAYDPQTKRLFVVAVDRGLIDTLDISDPSEPRLITRKLLLGYGGFPSSLDVENGVLAVALRGILNTLPGKVLFFDVDGRRIAPPVRVGAKPIELAYSAMGRELVVANQGEANSQYTIDPAGSVGIIELGLSDPDCRGEACAIEPEAVLLDFRDFNDRRDELVAEGIRIYGPNASVAQDLEPEAVAIAPDGKTAWVSLQRNNAMAVVDIPGREIDDVFALGTKNHSLPANALDASDRDGAINIRPWPLRSFYQADIFAAYDVGGSTFLVTPNEGDPRDSDGFSEDVRVRDLRLDPAAFPDAADLQADRNLGRLRATNVDGDGDGDGDFDQIFLLGSRSFAIWTAAGRLVFDSGDDLERIIAEAVPACFNCSDSGIDFDGRSPDRGPEPETAAVGSIGDRHYAFIAPERVGGVYVYDVTDPAAPSFQQYINFRDFSVDPDQVCEENRPQSEECAQAGDLGPEGVLFIPAQDSPIGVPMIAVSHELSTSTTLYRIDAVR
jgi:hypothetical protein